MLAATAIPEATFTREERNSARAVNLHNENPQLDALGKSSPTRTRERTKESTERNHGLYRGGARFARLRSDGGRWGSLRSPRIGRTVGLALLVSDGRRTAIQYIQHFVAK